MERFSLGATRIDSIRSQYTRGTGWVKRFAFKLKRQGRGGSDMYRRAMVDVLDKGRMELPYSRRKRGRSQQRFMEVVIEDMQRVGVIEEETGDKMEAGYPLWRLLKEAACKFY